MSSQPPKRGSPNPLTINLPSNPRSYLQSKSSVFPKLSSTPPEPRSNLPPNFPPKLPTASSPKIPLNFLPKLPSNTPPKLPSNIPPKLPSNIPPKLPSNIPPKLPSNTPPKLSKNIPASLPPNVPASLPPNVPASLPPNIPASLPPNIPASLPPNIPASLPPNIPPKLSKNIPASLPPNIPPSNPSISISTPKNIENISDDNLINSSIISNDDEKIAEKYLHRDDVAAPLIFCDFPLEILNKNSSQNQGTSDCYTPSSEFKIMLFLPNQESFLIETSPEYSLSDLLINNISTLSIDYVSSYHCVSEDGGEIILNSQLLVSSPYILDKLSRSQLPKLYLKASKCENKRLDLLSNADKFSFYGEKENPSNNNRNLQNSYTSTSENSFNNSMSKIEIKPRFPNEGILYQSTDFQKKFTFRDNLAKTQISPNEFEICFFLPGDEFGGEDHRVIAHACGSDEIRDLKKKLAKEAKAGLASYFENMDKYLFKVPGASFLTNENETLDSLPYVHNCIMRKAKPIFIVLDRSAAICRRTKKNDMEIGSLIGNPLTWVQQDDEITTFRQSMTRLRYFWKLNKSKSGDLSPNMPLHIGNTISPSNGINTLIQLRFEELQLKKTLTVEAEETIDQLIQKYFTKISRQFKSLKPWNNYVLKVTGLSEYLYGPNLFHSFDYIKECINKNNEIDLCLCDVCSVDDSVKCCDDESNLEDEEFLVEDPNVKYVAEEMELGEIENMTCISSWNIDRQLRVKIIGIENISFLNSSFLAAYGSTSSSNKPPSSCNSVSLCNYVTVGLYHGGELVEGTSWCSSVVPSSNNPRWNQWTEFLIPLNQVPLAARLCFTAWVGKRNSSESDMPLGWVNYQLFDYKHELRTGMQCLNMWPEEKANPIGTCMPNDGKNPTTLYISLDKYALPVVFPTETKLKSNFAVPTSMHPKEQDELEKIIDSDPLYILTQRDKHLLWNYREFLKFNPKALPKFLLSVPVSNIIARNEMYRIMDTWKPISPIDTLELLDSKFADANIRKYAIKRLQELPTSELLDYLLQLVQVLKYESYHDTVLAQMLILAGLNNKIIGHQLFWYLKSEIHVPEVSERYSLIIEAYLRGCGSHRIQLSRQNEMQQRLLECANTIKATKEMERIVVLREELAKIPFPPEGISIPLNPRIEVTGFKIEKCKYMDSKKMPLWLVFKNKDVNASDIYIIFKSGDDLRQDMLTLQMIRIMDNLWKKAGLDFRLHPYGCISTGNEVGMIEVVLNAETTASITRSAGGASAAFREDPIAVWLSKKNPTEAQYRIAVDNFIYSCAGYCVATYILGIGDRHNDNVMITQDGKLFHIDFGHFLGNFKKKFGVKRERAPFVFTPDFAYVMGGKDGKNFARFLELCGKAYNVLRKNANIFINLFAMMLSTGIPELQTADDIEYLRDAFSSNLTDQQAADKFSELVQESMHSRTTQINNAIHILAH